MRDNGRPPVPPPAALAASWPDADPTADRPIDRPADPDAVALFAGPGEMRARGRALDWAATPLGPVAGWPAALRAAVRLSADSGFAMCVFAGPALVLVYNDGYREALGPGKHPDALGRPAREVWAEIWDQIAPEFAGIMAGGPPVRREHQRFVIARDGAGGRLGDGLEETYWTYAFSPVRADDGAVVGVHSVVAETTARVRAEAALRASEARQAFLLRLSDALRSASDAVTVQDVAARTLGEHLGLSRVFYAPVEPRGDGDDVGDDFVVAREYHAPEAASIVGRYPVEGVGARLLEELRAGRTVAAADLATQTLLSEAERVIYAGFGAHAYVAVPLIKGGRLAALMTAHQNAPRGWTRTEVALIEETADRTWAAVDRARAEAALRAHERRYGALFDALDEGFYFARALFDDAGRCVDVAYWDENAAAVRMTGRSFAGRRLSELGAYEPYWREIFGHTARSGEAQRLERYAAPDGRWYEFDVFRYPGAGADEFAVVFRDVTARKQTEAALRESEEKYRTVFESMDEGFLVHEMIRDAAGRVVDYRLLDANPAHRRATGLPPETVGKRGSEFMPDVEPYWLDLFHRVSTTGVAERAEMYNAPTARWYNVQVSPVRGHDRIAIVFDDVTARKRAARALRASEERQAFLLTLSDALRPLDAAADIQGEAARLLREHLAAGWCYYVEWDEAAARGVVLRDAARDGLPSLAGTHDVADVPAFFDRLRTGAVLNVGDYAGFDGLSPALRARYAALGFRSMLVATLVKQGRLVASLIVGDTAARDWSASEEALLTEVAERTWAAVERARAEAALRESEARLQLVLEAAALAAFEWDLAGDRVAGNAQFRALYGVGPDESVVTASRILAATHPDDRALVDAHLRRAMDPADPASPGRYAFEYRIARPDADGALRGAPAGEPDDTRWVLTHGQVYFEGAGADRRPVRVLGTGMDVTERRRAEDARRASEARYRTLVAHVRDYAIFLLDADGRVTEWPAGAERVTGFPAAEALGQPLARFYAPEEAGLAAAHLAEAARDGRGEWEGWRVRRDGSRFWANEVATAVRDGDGRLAGFTKISRDLTERRLAEEAAEQRRLAEARDELRRALSAAEEAERRRLARELHDQLGQHLTAFALALADTRRRLDAGEPLAGRLDHLEALARGMTRDARALALELRPPELDDVGLVSAVETYVREWGARTGVAAELAVTGVHDREVSAEAGSALYRILQEALTNVARHAHATQVSVIVEQPDGVVGLIVEDDGRGFDPDEAAARVRRDRRLGLAGMRERAALAGGTVAVESSPGAGTTVYVRLPAGLPAGTPPVDGAPRAPEDAGGPGPAALDGADLNGAAA